MRLWSIHPKYLDAQGLVALWREGLLAQKVLEGRTKGYRDHPQLDRFKKARDPLTSIGTYLKRVVNEANIRGYSFDESKILTKKKSKARIKVTKGQIQFEFEHLKRKLHSRAPKKFFEIKKIRTIKSHGSFLITSGSAIEPWERARADGARFY